MLIVQEYLKSNWNFINHPCLYNDHRNDLCSGLDCFQWKSTSQVFSCGGFQKNLHSNVHDLWLDNGNILNGRAI